MLCIIVKNNCMIDLFKIEPDYLLKVRDPHNKTIFSTRLFILQRKGNRFAGIAISERAGTGLLEEEIFDKILSFTGTKTEKRLVLKIKKSFDENLVHETDPSPIECIFDLRKNDPLTVTHDIKGAVKMSDTKNGTCSMGVPGWFDNKLPMF